MSKKLILLSFFFVVLGLALSVPAGAAQFLVEHFNYANGTDLNGQVAGQGGWVTDGTNYMVLNDDGLGDGGTSSLQYVGLTDSQGGRLIPAGDCDYILSTPVVGEGNALYLSLLLKPTVIATSYFTMFATDGSANGSLGRLTGRESGGQQELGVRLRKSNDDGWSGKAVALGETALVVIKLTMVPGPDNDTMELWVNPTVGTPEPPADVGPLGGQAGNDVNPERGIQGFRFRSSGAKEVDEIRFGTTWDDVIGSVGGAEAASAPSPGNGAEDVLRDVVLSWKSGGVSVPTNGHKLFLSDNFNDVNDGIGGIILDTNEYIPDQLLDYGATYYWRVDEANETGWNTGNIWSFQVEPFGRPIPGDSITVAADSNDAGQGPENTINGSGLTEDDLHGTELTTMWLSAPGGLGSAWIQYSFDKVYALHELHVWNYNGEGLNTMYGFREVTIEYSADGVTWTPLENVPEFAQAPGTADYAPAIVIDFKGVIASQVRITALSNWSPGGVFDQYGLSEVRFLYVPMFARLPQPLPGQTVNLDVTLTWRAGREAALHDVYVGTDPNALPLVDTISENSFNTLPLDLQLDQTYYWKIDEVNDSDVPGFWEGDIWQFSTLEYLVVDDFESYTDNFEAGEAIWQAWIDGLEDPQNGGSQVGYGEAPFAERSIIHGGRQSMPLSYDNSQAAAYSLAERTFDPPQNWGRAGIQGLVLYFYGHSENAPAQLYVKVNNTRVLYDGDMEALQRMSWQKWYIPLADHLSSNELAQVKSLTIGVEGSGGGILLVDDIFLTADSRNLITPVEPTPDSLVTHYAFDGDTLDSTGAHPATAMGFATFETGKVGQAISLAGVFGDYLEISGYKGILGSSAITVTAWINTSATETGTIIGWGPAAPDGGRFGFRVDDNRIRCEFSGGNVQGTTTVNHGGWQHVAVTVKANTAISYPDVTLWVDGVDDTEPSTDETIINILADDTQDARIGSRPSAEDRWFGGLIDELYIYDRVLTAEEIAGAAGRSVPFDQ